MLPPDQLSVPDKEDLRHRILFVHRKRNDILVLAVTVRNLLPLADPAHAVDQITVLRRLLEPHLLSRLRHFSSQLFDNVIVISIQKTDRLFDLLAVLFFGNVSLARCLTLVDVIVKTRAVTCRSPLAGSYCRNGYRTASATVRSYLSQLRRSCTGRNISPCPSSSDGKTECVENPRSRSP